MFRRLQVGGVGLTQVIGQDVSARFIDAACRLQAGQTVEYVVDGQTHVAVASPTERLRNVIFKQVSADF